MTRMSISRVIIVSAFTAILVGCVDRKEGEEKTSLLSNFISISDNEDKGVKEILEFYGGECEYSFGASASTDKGKLKYFELEMRKSSAIEKYSHVAQMPASNIAYLFYRNLKSEKNNYDEIHTVIKFADGSQVTFKYPVQELEIVSDRMPVVEKIIAKMKNKDFEGIKASLNDESLIKYDKNELVLNMEQLEPSFGQVKEFVPYGFRIEEFGDNKRILHISGAVMRDKQNHEFSADFDLDAPKEELLRIEYQL